MTAATVIRQPLSVTIMTQIGDSILFHPDLIRNLTADDEELLDWLPKPYIAVHPFSRETHKAVPQPARLLNGLHDAGLNVVLLGSEPTPLGTKQIIHLPADLKLCIEAVARAGKFIGSLSCFNVVAQVKKIPSFVLVNKAVRDPYIYEAMTANDARVEPCNGDKMLDQVFAEAVEWARKP